MQRHTDQSLFKQHLAKQHLAFVSALNKLYFLAGDDNEDALANIRALLATKKVTLNSRSPHSAVSVAESAVIAGRLDVIKFIVNDPTTIIDRGNKNNLLYIAIFNLNPAVLLFIATEAIIQRFNDGTTMAHAYAATGNMAKLKALATIPNAISAANQYQETPLFYATLAGEQEAVLFLYHHPENQGKTATAAKIDVLRGLNARTPYVIDQFDQTGNATRLTFETNTIIALYDLVGIDDDQSRCSLIECHGTRGTILASNEQQKAAITEFNRAIELTQALEVECTKLLYLSDLLHKRASAYFKDGQLQQGLDDYRHLRRVYAEDQEKGLNLFDNPPELNKNIDEFIEITLLGMAFGFRTTSEPFITSSIFDVLSYSLTKPKPELREELTPKKLISYIQKHITNYQHLYQFMLSPDVSSFLAELEKNPKHTSPVILIALSRLFKMTICMIDFQGHVDIFRQEDARHVLFVGRDSNHTYYTFTKDPELIATRSLTEEIEQIPVDSIWRTRSASKPDEGTSHPTCTQPAPAQSSALFVVPKPLRPLAPAFSELVRSGLQQDDSASNKLHK